MNVGQNGDPDDCVRFGYLWGLNGGELGLLARGRYLTATLHFQRLPSTDDTSTGAIPRTTAPARTMLVWSTLTRELVKAGHK